METTIFIKTFKQVTEGELAIKTSKKQDGKFTKNIYFLKTLITGLFYEICICINKSYLICRHVFKIQNTHRS